jgi:hypothetical protein
MDIAEMTQTVTVVIDGNRLVMEHAQEMLELMEIGWLWRTEAETQRLKHKCWSTDAETQSVGTQMLVHRC